MNSKVFKFSIVFLLALLVLKPMAWASSTTLIPIQLPMPSVQTNETAMVTSGKVITMPGGASFIVESPGLKIGRTQYQFDLQDDDRYRTALCQLYRPNSIGLETLESKCKGGYGRIPSPLVASIGFKPSTTVYGEYHAFVHLTFGSNCKQRILSCSSSDLASNRRYEFKNYWKDEQ